MDTVYSRPTSPRGPGLRALARARNPELTPMVKDGLPVHGPRVRPSCVPSGPSCCALAGEGGALLPSSRRDDATVAGIV
jgi:hypothetical protein